MADFVQLWVYLSATPLFGLTATLLVYVFVMSVVFAVNLLPAFGPPTWAVLIFLKLNLGVAAVPLVVCGALAAAAGRRALKPRVAPAAPVRSPPQVR